ncbi:unnamed protein product [marine sediment metagenome]|uniref:Uncharacterized protein n=1 Tax=marine sediment metagenome TaxID=412755 RepID=X1DDY1_9ZZZZ
MSDKVTKTFTITANSSLMGQIERFLACLHLFTNWGHSSYVGFSQDGDGGDLATVEGEDFDPQKYRVYANWVSNYPVRKRDIDSVDASLRNKDYIEYRDGLLVHTSCLSASCPYSILIDFWHIF